MENFIQQPPLDVGDIRAISNGATLVRLSDKQIDQSILLYVEEARALRDWLTTVLPESAQETSPARETVGEFVQRVREQASVPRFTGPYGGDCTICGHTYDSHGDNLLECPTANR